MFLISMSVDMPELIRPAAASTRSRLRLRIRRPRRQGPRSLGSCPVCRGRVREDDALGLVGSTVAHAECALVSWLGAGRLSRELH